MAGSNNDQVKNLPLTPHPALKQLAPLLGTWKNEGVVLGISKYRMGLGGHYMIQESEATTPRGRKLDDDGTCWTWFGDKGSDNFFTGKRSKDGKTITGRWYSPGGGLDVISKKVGE